jgi:hypothetical protein
MQNTRPTTKHINDVDGVDVDCTLEVNCAAAGFEVTESQLVGNQGRYMGKGVIAVRDHTEVNSILGYYWGRLLLTANLTDAQIKRGCVMEFHTRKLQVFTYICLYATHPIL